MNHRVAVFVQPPLKGSSKCEMLLVSSLWSLHKTINNWFYFYVFFSLFSNYYADENIGLPVKSSCTCLIDHLKSMHSVILLTVSDTYIQDVYFNNKSKDIRLKDSFLGGLSNQMGLRSKL